MYYAIVCVIAPAMILRLYQSKAGLHNHFMKCLLPALDLQTGHHFISYHAKLQAARISQLKVRDSCEPSVSMTLAHTFTEW